jgi:hypothetical protein
MRSVFVGLGVLLAGGLVYGCSSGGDEVAARQDSVTSIVAKDVGELFAKDSVSVTYTPSSVTRHGEAVARLQTPKLNVFLTFQNEDAIAWPDQEETFTFHPAKDWDTIVGRDRAGAMIDVPRASVADFIAQPDRRQDICNGAVAEVRDVTVTDGHGHTWSKVRARLTIFTRFATGNEATIGTQSTDGDNGGGGGGGGSSGGGGDKNQQPKQCKAQGGSSGASGASTQSVFHDGAQVSGLLNAGCPIFFWSAGGCSGTCQRRLNLNLLIFSECLWAGTPGTCTPHNRRVMNAKTGIEHDDPSCSCD